MRARLAILPVLLAAVVAAFPMTPAIASSGDALHLSQAEPGDETTEQGNQGGQGEDPEAEVGADEGSSEEGATETEVAGPLWTYQMARMSFALLLVLLLGAGFWYYRFVVTRQRG